MLNLKINPNAAVVRGHSDIKHPTFKRVTVPLRDAFEAIILREDSLLKSHLSSTLYTGGRLFHKNAFFEVYSEDESVATVDALGNITRVSDGIANIIIAFEGTKYRLMLDVSEKALSGVALELHSPIAGSLVYHTHNQFLNAFDISATVESNGYKFTQSNYGEFPTLNPNWVFRDFDTTGCSYWNSHYGRQRAGTAITRRHIISAAHYPLKNGVTVRFMTDDNESVSRTIIGSAYHPDYSGSSFDGRDYVIHTLDADLPPEISHFKIAPDELPYYGTQSMPYTRPKFFGLTQNELAIVMMRTSKYGVTVDAEDPIFGEFSRAGVSGDSGNPILLPVGGELLLRSCFKGPAGGPRYYEFIEDFNREISSADAQAGISTGYTVTEADFSMWPNFTTQNYLVEDSDIANGNASLWVEAGTVTGKESYIMRESSTDYWTLSWNGSAWVFTATGSPSSSFSDTAEDGATPDAATFSTLNFSTPN